MSQATKDKLSRAGKARWRRMPASQKASAIRRLTGKTARRAKSGARSAGRSIRRRASSAGRVVRHRSKSKITNMSVGQVFEAAPAVGGLIRAAKAAWANKNFYPDEPLGFIGVLTSNGSMQVDRHAVKTVIEPALNGAIDSAYLGAVRRTSLTAPIVKDVLNIRPLAAGGLKLPKVSVKRVLVGLPSAAGYVAAGQKLATDAYYGHGLVHIDDNLMPSINTATILPKYAPIPVGGVGSKVLQAGLQSGLVPAPVKRLTNYTLN